MVVKKLASDASPEEVAGQTAPAPIDLLHLARYTLGERALEREVLELFCAQSKLYLAQLRAAATDKE